MVEKYIVKHDWREISTNIFLYDETVFKTSIKKDIDKKRDNLKHRLKVNNYISF
jgi:hypothetical protein